MFQVSKKQRLSPSSWSVPTSTNAPTLCGTQSQSPAVAVALASTGSSASHMNIVQPLYHPSTIQANAHNASTAAVTGTAPSTATVSPTSYYHRKRKQTILNARYNGQRPNYFSSPRVSLSYYPDPTVYGDWTFTGSDSSQTIEYYEKEVEGGLVKLDFYFMNGTVKTEIEQYDTTATNSATSATSMDCGSDYSHCTSSYPTASSRVIQLYSKGKQLLPDVYKKILQNPLVHTDARYHRHLLH